VYNVIYNGRRLTAPNSVQQRRRGEHLEVPLNQIWVSEKLKKVIDVVLFHELQELKYKRRGYSAKKAHKMARRDEAGFKRQMAVKKNPGKHVRQSR
jgi:hypothetical protein